MASSKLKLIYFDVRGLGELARLELAYAGKEYEETRVKPADWPQVKPTIEPLGQMPVLEIDGERFPQSTSINNFLAKEFGLYPKTNREQMIVDIVTSTILDIIKVQQKWMYGAAGPEKEKLAKEAPEATGKYLTYLDSLLAKNKTGYFIGNSLTLADLAMFDCITGYARKSMDFTDSKYPNIAKNRDNVLKNKNIGDYVAKRPDLPM